MRRTAVLLLTGASLWLAAPALAAPDDPYVRETPTTVCAEAGVNAANPAVCTSVLGVVEEKPAPRVRVAARDTGSSLPVTGGDVTQLAIIGAGAVALGSVLVRKSRARTV